MVGNEGGNDFQYYYDFGLLFCGDGFGDDLRWKGRSEKEQNNKSIKATEA